jgi:hypothetical protein
MNPVEKFKKHWSALDDNRKQNYSLKENLILQNNAIAQVAIYQGDKCVAFGNYFEKLELPTQDEIRTYFHGNNGFIACGTSSLFWFYFDEEKIIINDHKYKYPFDEVMKDYYEFLDRITKQ